jgi:hypothetical protein
MRTYRIITVCAASVCKGLGSFRRPRHIRIVQDGCRATGVGYTAVAEWRNVDSRYTGPKSAYGQSMESARQTLAALQAAWEQAVLDGAEESQQNLMALVS